MTDGKASSAGSTLGRASRLGRIFRGSFAQAKGSAAPSHRRLRGALSTAALSLLVLAAPSAAPASIVHPFQSSLSASFANPESLALDQSNGDLYVLDAGEGRVKRFDQSGAPAPFSASQPYINANQLTGSAEGAFSFAGGAENQIALAPPGAPAATAGDLYVAEPYAGAIDVFDPSGEYLGRITEAAGSGIAEACGVATDPAGNLYVGTYNSAIEKYHPTTDPPTNADFDSQITGVGGICNIAAGTESVYGSGWSEGPLSAYPTSLFPGNQESADASAAGTVIEAGGAPATSTTAFVDPQTDDLYVDAGNRIAQFDKDGNLLGRFGAAQLQGSHGLAIDRSGGLRDGDLYASDSATGLIDLYGPAETVNPPTAGLDPITTFDDHSATFTATVNSGGTGANEATEYRFACSPECPGLKGPQPITSDGSDQLVEEAISGLIPNTEYTVTLLAQNQGGETTSQQAFTTTAIKPDATTAPAQDISPEHAVLEGLLHAHHAPTTYFFEYGTTTAYGSSIPLSEDADGGEENQTTAVIQSLYGLQPHTTYHFRLIAENMAGVKEGQDETFTTTSPPAEACPNEARRTEQHSAFLPDCRAYEMVSPTQKHGNDVMNVSARTRAAAIETPTLPMAATFSSLGGFADAHGTGVANDYMAIRDAAPGTSGWATHSITPQQDPLTILGIIQAFESEWSGELSPDLTTGVYRAQSSLTDDPNVAEVENLYRRDDLRAPGNGAYQLLSDCPACSEPLPAIFQLSQLSRFAGASADFSHIIFESPFALTADAPPASANCLNFAFDCQPHLYEWVNGSVRLVGLIPPPGESSCGQTGPACVAPPVSLAGQGTGAGAIHTVQGTPHTISADGSRIIFTDPSSGDGQSTGNLYMRIDGTETVQLNASEKEAPDEPQPAAYQDASTEGSRVFFTTGEQLTDEPAPGSPNLYMYDANAPQGERLTLVSVGHNAEDKPNGVQGVMGASANGHYVYFIAAGQFVAGQPVLTTGTAIYEWHDGAISYVGRLADSGDQSFDTLPGYWAILPFAARVTPDGRHLLFMSSSGVGLTNYQQNEHAEFYLYSADSHELQCVSCNPTGAPAGGDASVMTHGQDTGASNTSSHQSQALTGDGAHVFFTSTDALLPEDTNGKADAYEFDTASGTVHLLSSGTDPSASYFMDASADGHDVLLTTRQRLVGWDGDSTFDLYDARAGGGLPDPSPRPAPCLGDGCRESVAVQPSASSPGSRNATGPGNPKPRRCRRHGHCHKRHPGRHRSHHNRGGTR